MFRGLIITVFALVLSITRIATVIYSVLSNGLLMAQQVKNPPANTQTGSLPKSGKSPGGGNGYPLQYSCLENPMDRGAWWATVHGITKSRI